MPTLTANYGYDIHQLELSDAEARLIQDRTNFRKSGEVWSEADEGMTPAVWRFDFEANEFWIYCENGASFAIHSYEIE